MVGFVCADDQRWALLKTVVSPTHALPGDLLVGAETVLVYFIPFQPFVAKSNIPGKFASREWALAYIETNRMILELNRHLQQELAKEGHQVVVIPATHNFDEEKLISDWSHRHVAYLAGLGDFGLNNMFITEKGCCGRLGSMVTDLVVEPSIGKIRDVCLYNLDGSCGKCVKKCVGDALTSEGFDRGRCYDMCLENAEIHKEIGLADVCGKCMVGVACSHRNPVGKQEECV